MVGTLFRRSPATAGAGVVHPAVAGMRLETERDARGFQLGVLVPGQGGDATIAVRVADSTMMTPMRVGAWHDEVSADETVMATCASTTLRGEKVTGVLWVTFAADGKKERKETSEFLTRLARSAPAVYDAADTHGMDTAPASADDLARWLGAQLGAGDDIAEFPPRVRAVQQRPDVLIVDGQASVGFEVDGHGRGEEGLAAVAEIARELSLAADGALTIRIGAWRRAVMDRTLPPRRVGVVTVIAPEDALAEDAARVLVAALPARDRLRVRRLWQRQAMAAGASLGAGVLGWQRLEVSA